EWMVSIAEKDLGHQHAMVGEDLVHLGIVYRALGKHSKAEDALLRAIQILRVRGEPRIYSLSLYNLACVYVDEDRFREAEPLFREALPAIERFEPKATVVGAFT